MTELYAVAIQKRLREYTVPHLLSYAMPDEWYFNSFFTQMRGEYPKQLYEDVFYRVYEESSEDRLKADWDSACQYLAENSTSK